ncbi:TonB-dependent receptor [Ideonella sp. YS5]|uniref:TonB-dependent receptor n=1 Tax=Ideonella sp. YS5 TaxID=3453714 RepID=UPI003EEAE568
MLHAPFRRRPLAAFLFAAWAGHVAAQSASNDDTLTVAAAQQIEVIGRHYDNAIGMSDAASQGTIRAELLRSRPALRPGEVLEFVPGLIVTQHSGDGKANQYFLRGFNLDHGTDFATTVAGMPVNMPSHAHGQGYTDLNFLLPELVDRIDYRKGPYFATHGDFASAGAADIVYKTRLDAPFAQLTLGENGYARAVGAASFDLSTGGTLLGAVETMVNDGPWTVPEGLRRNNALLSYAQGSRQGGWSASLMAYDARWTATDQVPQSLIDQGRPDGTPFGRFDSLDPTDGGSTSRYSLSGEWHRRGDEGDTQVSAYAMRYRLKLFSNFTYALERPDTGDQFSQQDARTVWGFKASHGFSHTLAGLDAFSEFGLQLRHDDATVGLFGTERRALIGTTRVDDVQETMVGVYGQTQLTLTPWLRSVIGLRGDHVRFHVDSLGSAANSGRTSDQQLSPKLSLIAGPWARTEFFFNAGRGLHSNDARGTTATVDPKTGDPVDKVPGLVASRGIEFGLRTEAIKDLQSSVALWQLKSDSELVYVGDAGATEASGASTRRGIEWNNRWTPGEHFLLDADLAWTHARFDNADRIPNAVDSVASVAAAVRNIGPWSASLQWRWLGPGALVEDNSVRSSPSSTFNLRISRALRDWLQRDAELTLDVFNLLDAKVDDIQYVYEYRLPGQPTSETGKVIHPAEPRSARLTLRVAF